MLAFGTKAHNALHTGAVVPRAVKEDDLATGREVFNISLEVPGGGLTRRRLLQSDSASATRVQVLVKALNGATLAGRVATLKDNDVALASLLGPVLPLQQLNLQSALHRLVLIASHTLIIGVIFPPSLNRGTIRHDQRRIIFIGSIDDVAVSFCQVDLGKVVVFNISHALSVTRM